MGWWCPGDVEVALVARECSQPAGSGSPSAGTQLTTRGPPLPPVTLVEPQSLSSPILGMFPYLHDSEPQLLLHCLPPNDPFLLFLLFKSKSFVFCRMFFKCIKSWAFFFRLCWYFFKLRLLLLWLVLWLQTCVCGIVCLNLFSHKSYYF